MIAAFDLGLFKDVSIIVAGAIAFLTLWQALFQYTRQNYALRATQFIDMRRRFLENATFREIMTLAQSDPAGLRSIPIQDRRNLAAFFEEVALLVNSKLMKPEVAHYMFGFYAKLIDTCPDFWHDLDKSSEYWTLFRGFVFDMERTSSKLRNRSEPMEV